MTTGNTKREEFTITSKNDLYPIDRSLAKFARDFMRSGAFTNKSGPVDKAVKGVRVEPASMVKKAKG
jgi:hypothetical protein